MAATAEKRHPAGLVAIALLLGAPALMLWIGRFKLAVIYALASQIIVALGVYLAINGILPMSLLARIDPFLVYMMLLMPIVLAALMHAWRLNTQPPLRPWYSRWFVALLAYPAISLPIAIGIRTFLYQPFSVPAGSSIPNLMIGDQFFVSKRAYQARDPQRGELAVFRKPLGPPTDYVKRVIGLPGDRIQMKSGVLYLNGAAVPREPADLPAEISVRPRLKYFRETLSSGQSYLIAEIGDDEAFDNTDEFVVPDGNYFVLGDNRDNSTDSRLMSQVGYVPRANFIGPVVLLYWNTNGIEIKGRPN